ALAAHWGLDNLIFIYDSNAVTLDAPAKDTQSEDTGKRMEAYGFDVQEIDGHDMREFLDAFDVARRRDNGKPQFIIAHTLIGKGIPEVAGTYKAHGEAGGEVLQPIAQAMPLLMSGSADLYGSTMNYIKDGGDFSRDNPGGRNIRFGIREHSMCAILNGISYHGLFRASGATFTVFTDYC